MAVNKILISSVNVGLLRRYVMNTNSMAVNTMFISSINEEPDVRAYPAEGNYIH